MTKKEFVSWLKRQTVIDTTDKKLVERMWLGVMARQLNHMSVQKFDEFIGQHVREGKDVRINLY